jgi:hypothetical protein
MDSNSDCDSEELDLGPDCMLGTRTESPRVILHIDCDSFFLGVHERLDSSLRGVPVALWQYNDVVPRRPESCA